MIEKSSWDDFLMCLDNSSSTNEFDKELKKYLVAIKAVSEINVKDINSDNKRNEIEKYLKTIETFINDNKDKYYELSLIKGFKSNHSADGKILSEGRDYYYYIADQKIKASVYYVRYLNFINRFFENEESPERELEDLIEKVKDKVANKNSESERVKMQVEQDNVISILDNELNDEEDTQQLRAQCINCLEKRKMEKMGKIEYLKYILFNNTMREIRYIGAAYQYLWHWEKREITLFRSEKLDNSECEQQNKENDVINNKNEFFKRMFAKCIKHMNSPEMEMELHSYSENPFLDIYKYLILKEDEEEEHAVLGDVLDESKKYEIKIDICYKKNKNQVRFKIIKNAEINAIFGEEKPLSFQEFAMDSTIEDMSKLPYSVEIFPQTLIGEKNEKGTTKYLRDRYFPEYIFRTWKISGNLIKTKVADDKEVITYDKCYKKEQCVEDNSKISFEEEESGTLFSIELNKNDIVYLLLKIKNIEPERIAEKILKYRKRTEDLERKIRYSYRLGTDCELSYAISFLDKDVFGIEIFIRKEYIESFKKNAEGKFELEEITKTVNEIIDRKLINWLCSKYKNILEKPNRKVDFILSVIRKNEDDFNLVSQYKEYMSDEEDPEIKMLKEIIFKEK